MNVDVALAHGLPLRGDGRIATVRPVTGRDEIQLARSSVGEIDLLLAAITSLDDRELTTREVRTLSVGDRNALLLAALVASYTSRLSWLVECANCGERLDLDLEIADLLDVAPDEPDPRLPPFRVPSQADLDAVATLPAPEARTALLDRCVGVPLDEAAADAVEAAMAVTDPLADITLSATCAACGASTAASVDPAAELQARLADPSGLIEDVHALALAYGWTEPDVLALPRPRRHDYLALVADLEP